MEDWLTEIEVRNWGGWDSSNPDLQEVAQVMNDSMSNGTLCQAQIWKFL